MLSKTLSVSRRFNAIAETADGLTEFTQLLYTLMVPHTDDFGRMSADPFSLKMTVLPASSRKLEDFANALAILHDVQLLTVYQVESDIWLQVNKFEDHQTGLHKRTESKIPDQTPGDSRIFPEVPGNSWSRARAELNGTEQKGREQKGTERNRIPVTNNKLVRKVDAVSTAGKNGNGHHARSKHPIFQGQRFVVFDWMLEDMGRILGDHLDAFDVHEWLFSLDAKAVKQALVKQKNDWWPWIQEELVSEAQLRGLPMQEPKKFGVTPKTAGNAAALARFVSRNRS